MTQELIIGFDDLHIDCIIGVYPEERTEPQPLYLSLALAIDPTAVFTSHDLNDTLNYAEIAALATTIAKEGKFYLLESYIQALIKALEKVFSFLWCRITVRKPQAIPLSHGATLSYTHYPH